MNLCGVFEDYFDWFCKEHKLDDKGIENAARIYNEIICPGVGQSIPAVNYTDIFAVNLRNLFRKIRKKERILGHFIFYVKRDFLPAFMA